MASCVAKGIKTGLLRRTHSPTSHGLSNPNPNSNSNGYHSATTKTRGTDSQLKQHRGHEISDTHREYLSHSSTSPKEDPHNKGILKLGLEVQGPHTHNHHY